MVSLLNALSVLDWCESHEDARFKTNHKAFLSDVAVPTFSIICG